MMTLKNKAMSLLPSTMCIWGFTLTARLSANWGIGKWILPPYVSLGVLHL